MHQPFLDFYRCPERFAGFTATGQLTVEPGYFRFGHDVMCFGRCSSGYSSQSPNNGLFDSLHSVGFNHAGIQLPFDLTQVVDNLRLERYTRPSNSDLSRRLVREGYYLARPLLGIPIRKHLQRRFLRGWDRITFPHWPVDATIEQLFEELMALTLKSHKADAIPFIWFWPEGASSCVMMTHDVETEVGVSFSSELMAIDELFRIRASLQVVPEGRYLVTDRFLDSIRQRGFELNIQDLNHDGRLFMDRKNFAKRAESINRYAKAYGARGFRSAAMYRNPDWYDSFDLSYDMSIPNVAHLDPQRGGCCTVFPYFIGNILELPLTTTQDYSLFHILDDYSIDLWKRQIDLIQQRHGLVSFIIHPDYIIPDRALRVYLALLEHLAQLRTAQNVWLTLPGEVDRWWRERSQMELIEDGGRWVITGPGADRARVAFATRDGDRVRYTVPNEPMPACRV